MFVVVVVIILLIIIILPRTDSPVTAASTSAKATHAHAQS